MSSSSGLPTITLTVTTTVQRGCQFGQRQGGGGRVRLERDLVQLSGGHVENETPQGGVQGTNGVL